MSKQVTINASFWKKLDDLKNITEEKVTNQAENILQTAVKHSPVDTGAYVESFSVTPRGFGGGRSRTSRNKPSLPEVAKPAKKQEELNRLLAELRNIKVFEEGGFTLRNRAPHANYVETRHGVFSAIRNVARDG